MMASQQRVTVSQQGDVKILELKIDYLVDYDVADSLTDELIEAVGPQAGAKVVVDMGGIEFLSSVGYSPFINLRSYIRKHDGRLILANMSEMIHEVFDATRLLINPSSPKSLFEYYPSVAEAVEVLRG
jgi:anti-anti-sigma factor